MKLYVSSFPTPVGPFSIGVDEHGAVAATAFGGIDALRRTAPAASELIPDEMRTAAARTQVVEVLTGERREFSLELAPAGSEFQKRVWALLRSIPFGETRSYGELARQLDSSARAVGRANATNPICLIVPCHRVIGADGSLTGFAFGETLKQRLLDLEGVVLRAPAAARLGGARA